MSYSRRNLSSLNTEINRSSWTIRIRSANWMRTNGSADGLLKLVTATRSHRACLCTNKRATKHFVVQASVQWKSSEVFRITSSMAGRLEYLPESVQTYKQKDKKAE